MNFCQIFFRNFSRVSYETSVGDSSKKYPEVFRKFSGIVFDKCLSDSLRFFFNFFKKNLQEFLHGFYKKVLPEFIQKFSLGNPQKDTMGISPEVLKKT